MSLLVHNYVCALHIKHLKTFILITMNIVFFFVFFSSQLFGWFTLIINKQIFFINTKTNRRNSFVPAGLEPVPASLIGAMTVLPLNDLTKFAYCWSLSPSETVTNYGKFSLKIYMKKVIICWFSLNKNKLLLIWHLNY